MNSTPSAIKSKLIEIVGVTLGVPAEMITDNFSSDDCGTWDSVRHVMLVLAIEDSFGIAFKEEEIWATMSFPALTKAVESRLAP
jgi:acyl carrier protein